jgi:hypothetical protein
VQPIKDLGNALYNDPLGTLQTTGEAIIHPLDSGLEAGSHMAELEEMAQLDGMMEDDTAAAQHRGEAYGGIAAAAITRGTIKTITRLRGGRVRVELEGGQSVEVPEGSIARDSYGNQVLIEYKGKPVEVNGKDSAKNVANYDKMKNDLFRESGKPNVSDAKLQTFIDKLYRDNAKIGNGSTADAVRHEPRTGEPVGGRFHDQKAQDSIKYLEKWLCKNLTARPSDRIEAERTIKDMRNALNRN